MKKVKKKSLKLYVAGKMTGVPLHNRPLFYSVAAWLRKQGYRVVNPAALDGNGKAMKWEECLKRDIRHLVTCDGIVMLPDWTTSRGALLEHYIAEQLFLKIFFVEPMGNRYVFQTNEK